jgi:hypothetical protein
MLKSFRKAAYYRRAYAAKPTRLYLVGLDGLVTYAGSNSDYIKSSIA